MAKRTTITAALPYANGGVHIGHLAGVYVPADIYARYLRLKKQEVVFIGGSDEHGVPVTIRARQEGITTQEVVDRYHSLIKKSFEDFGISFDIYSRTTSEGAYGDQCEKCGATLSPDELINPKSSLSGSPLVKKATKHWYLPLDQYEAWLSDWILNGHKEWRSNVYGQCKSL